ncbi:NF-kappa-B-repressing factor [Lamellibrachia satsuma]|nr:NF-kappa-B-repressing factor [Lamellibrachia satsuma]
MEAEFDVDKYRHSHESRGEWDLRRQFLLAHHEDLPLDRLLCMASCFVNVECYGCCYPLPVMQQLKMLTESLKDTVEEHREAARKKTEVKFVAAANNGGAGASSSDGIESYQTVKGRQGTQNSQQCKTLEPISFVKSSDKYQTTEIVPQSQTLNSISGGGTTIESESPVEASARPHPMDDKFYTLKTHVELSTKQTENSIEAMYMAVDKAKMHLSTEFHDTLMRGFCCDVFVDSVMIGTGTATNKKAAKHAAFNNAVSVLSSEQLHVVGGDKLKLHSSNSGRVPSVVTATNQFLQPAENECAAATSRKRKSLPVPLTDFIIIESVMRDSPTATSILNESATFNKMSLTYDFRNLGMNGVQCQLFINDLPFADATGQSQPITKKLASEKALAQLRESSWTINIKKHEDTDNLGITKDELLGEIQTNKTIPTSNIGSKLLMKMGWTGGGVGKEGNEGIAEPVSVFGVIRRSGLGFHSDKGIGSDFLPKIRQTLQDYIRSGNEDDIAFASDFSKEERAMIHVECRKVGLKSRSHGTGEERYLVVGRKRSAAQLFTHLMESGGETSKYVLVPPGQSVSPRVPPV